MTKYSDIHNIYVGESLRFSIINSQIPAKYWSIRVIEIIIEKLKITILEIMTKMIPVIANISYTLMTFSEKAC